MKDTIITLLTVILKPLSIAIAIYLVVYLLSGIGLQFIKQANNITVATNYTIFTNIVITVTNPNPGWLYDENKISSISDPIIPFASSNVIIRK